VQGNSAELGRLLGEHIVDIIIRADFDPSSELATIPLARSSLVVACNADHALAVEGPVELQALSGSTLVGYPLGWGTRELSDRAFRSVGMEPHYAFEVNDIPTLLNLVDAGLGAALIPDAIAARGDQLRRVAITGPPWDYVIAAETLAPRPQNPAAQALWAILAEDTRRDLPISEGSARS
jgi:DNA-binding transcriptional LysR family regulator